MDVLKTCPFCGEVPQKYMRLIRDKTYYFVICENIKCCANPETRVFSRENAAVEAWNKRVNE